MLAQDSWGANSAATPRPHKRVLLWTMVGYSAMVFATIGVFLLMRRYGETLAASSVAPGVSLTEPLAQSPDVLQHVLVALAAVVVTGQLLARLFAYLSQPPVIGEVIAGIMLGPSLLGPEMSALILPPTVASFLGIIAQFGVILYMFIVGLDLNAGLLKHRAHATVATSHASISCPSSSGRCWRCTCIRGSRIPACRSRASRCSWAWPCRSPPFLSWHES
jgi:hypothetical protein